MDGEKLYLACELEYKQLSSEARSEKVRMLMNMLLINTFIIEWCYFVSNVIVRVLPEVKCP